MNLLFKSLTEVCPCICSVARREFPYIVIPCGEAFSSAKLVMGSKSNKKIATRKASFKTSKKPNKTYNRRNWEIYPAPASSSVSQSSQNSRLLYGYYSNNTFCCDDSECSEDEYKADRPWPRVPKRSSKSSNKSALRNSSSSSKYVSTTTTTKTLVSLKSCRSVSEIETLPPSGYFASTVVQHKQTYVNDTFVSDNEDDECYSVSACCKER